MSTAGHALPPLALTPEAGTGLVAQEAFAALPTAWDKAACPVEEFTPERLARNLALPPGRSAFARRPDLFYSINFRGLDKHGEAFALWQSHGVPVAVWCVDNPWNLLSGLRSDFWKQLHLFVTDASFIPGLLAHGARHVRHLPLAADTGRFCPAPTQSAAPPAAQGMRPVVFVGRSAFPDKERFFVGQSVPQDLLHKAEKLSQTGQRPDFFWWLKELGLDGPGVALWPGSAARKAALGAEECSLAWRLCCVRAALPCGLSLYGDAGWHGHFPAAADTPDLREPLDYYGSLPAVYHAAEFSLNMTSFLLPRGLNQRHFDVWAAGGFCLMDASPGLELFPQELTRPVTFTAAKDIPHLVAAFQKDPKGKRELAQRWQRHITAEHSYALRMKALVDAIFA